MRSESQRERGVRETACIYVCRWHRALWAFERTLALALSYIGNNWRGLSMCYDPTTFFKGNM